MTIKYINIFEYTQFLMALYLQFTVVKAINFDKLVKLCKTRNNKLGPIKGPFKGINYVKFCLFQRIVFKNLLSTDLVPLRKNTLQFGPVAHTTNVCNHNLRS
jgi:hypothetical protein